MRKRHLSLLLLALMLALSLAACGGEEITGETPVEDVNLPDEGGVFGDADEGLQVPDQEVVDEEDLLDSEEEPFLDVESAIEEPSTDVIGGEDVEVGGQPVDEEAQTGELATDDEAVTEEGDGEEEDEIGAGESPGLDPPPEEPTALRDLAEVASERPNEDVLVEAEVNRVLDPLAVTLGQEDILLVLTESLATESARLAEGTPIRVRGLVQEFDRPALEARLGRELDENLYGEFTGRPVILAAPPMIQLLE